MDEACVIGLGVVGKATADVFGIKKSYDLVPEKCNITLEDASKCRFVFICLPTPVNPDGTYNTSDITQIIKGIEDYGGAGIYIIRSTVWPGFANHLMDEVGIDRVVSNPEFLSEATAEKDSKFPPFILLGSGINRYLQELQGVYESRIKSAPIILTDNTTAELAKLALNGFFAVKVIYANQIYDVANQLGANYERIKEVLERHPFGFKNHAQVWFKGKRGVNGKCLPKDTQALFHYSQAPLIQKILELNEEYIYQKEEG